MPKAKSSSQKSGAFARDSGYPWRISGDGLVYGQDTQSCLALATRDDNSAKTKYFAFRKAYVRETVKKQLFDLKFIASGGNCPYIFTTELVKTKMQHHLARLSPMRGRQCVPSVSQSGTDRMISLDP